MVPLLLLLLLVGSGKKRKNVDVDVDVDVDEPVPAQPNAPKPDAPAQPNAPKPKPKPQSKAYEYLGPLIDYNNVPNYGLTPEQVSAAKTVASRVSNETYIVKPRNADEVSALAGAIMTEAQALAMLTYWKLRNAGYPRLPTLDKTLSPAETEIYRGWYLRLEKWWQHALAP